MDANEARNDYRWTNERHLCFLKSVEASFVRKMFENVDGRVLQMGRYMPDSCESTVDLKSTISSMRQKRRFSEDNLDINLSIDPRGTRLRLHPSSPSFQDDKVVPLIKHLKTNDDDDKNWISL